MTRDGAIAENQTTGETERISNRIRDADLQKTPEQQAAQDAMQLPPVSDTSPLPHAPGTAPKADTGKAERVMERLDAAHTRKTSKKAVRRAQEEAAEQTKSSRLQFTDEELATPELEKYIKKSDKAADRLDKAKAAIPKQKKLVKERTFDEATGKGKTRLHFEEQDKPPGFKEKHNPLSRPAQEAGIFVHNKIHSVEKDNSGVEGAHKTEEAAERGVKYGARKLKQGYRSHKLKPYREAAKAEKAAFKANVDFQYHKTLHDNPQLTSNPLSRFWQKQQIKKQYAKAAKQGSAKGIKAAAENTRKAAKKAAEKTKQTAAFVARHPAGVAIAVGALLLFILIMSGLSSCGAMFSGTLNGVLGTSYTSEDSDLVEVENAYAGLESELQREIDNIESTHSGYDEYRYDLANIGHNPHELASYLTAKYQSYTRADVQTELQRIFEQQYKLTLTEEVEMRYREEERTDTWTDEDGNEHTDTYTVQVPYEYYILNVKLTNTPLSTIAENNLTPEQLEMYRVYLQTSGNKPLIFGGGSPDTSVDFVNGTRPGNTAIVDLAKQQVGNVGGYPYWSWYGFNSRVEWCACFVSWCYGQAGLSEPRFAACQSQGIPWFTSHGQWGARGYENIAPGDAIFFDWDLDGSADHVGLVIGRDESRVYTVEGNSGDACKIKSYPLDYACIKGYGLMNWN
ncbi:MAG: CHAP domain-containing protein [Subdoligranulum sp.]|nr:CHAP domain-containing protein [Subdoligranulum sp.]